MKSLYITLILFFASNYALAQTPGDIIKELYASEFPLSGPNSAEIEITDIELNNKEPKEILARFLHREYCGSRGCSSFIVTKVNNAWAEITPSLITHGDLEVLKEKNNGFYNIRFGEGKIWEYDGNSYK